MKESTKWGSRVIVKVVLDDGDFRECTFEASVKVNADWRVNFSDVKKISEAVCTAFLNSTEGKPRMAYKEYDADFTLQEGGT